jgi:Flp pilus assembly protein TadD
LASALDAFNQGKYALSLVLLEKEIQANPEDPNLFFHFALACFHTSNFKKCSTVIMDLLIKFPRYIELDRCYKLLIYSLIQLKQWNEAEEEIKKRLSISPNDLVYLSFLAHIHEKAHRVKDSILIHRKILAFQPNHTNSLNNLGYLLLTQTDGPTKEELAEAITSIKKAVQLSPQNPAYLDSFGTLLDHTGNREAAIRALEKALAFAPDHTDLLNHLSRLKKPA